MKTIRGADDAGNSRGAVPPGYCSKIGDRADVFLDGGVRRGTDVITALALGARAVFVGRPYLYALAAGGEAGVGAMFQIFREEMERAGALVRPASSRSRP